MPATPATGDAGVVDLVDRMAGCKAASECGADKPVCEAGSCRACASAADDAVCLSRSAAAPRCQAASGRCVACRADTEPQDCTAARTPVCDSTSSTCRACGDHADCRSGACLLDGSCAPAGMVTWVDNRGLKVSDCNAQNPDVTGSKNKPWCDIHQALGHPWPYIVVAPSAQPYGPVSVSSGTWTLLGPLTAGAMRPRVDGAYETNALTVLPNQAANLTLNVVALEIANATAGGSGIACAVNNGGAALLTVLRSSVHDNDGVGLSTLSCTVTVDSSRIYRNQGGGLDINGGTYAITNSFITANGLTGRGVSLSDSAAGTFAFNTVSRNFVLAGNGGIYCGGGAVKVISNSIVAGNAPESGSQFFGYCKLINVVTDLIDKAGGTVSPPAFVDIVKGDYHLLPNDPRNADCCIDKVAAPGTPNADHDVDSSARPKGAGWDIGAHEVR